MDLGVSVSASDWETAFRAVWRCRRSILPESVLTGGEGDVLLLFDDRDNAADVSFCGGKEHGSGDAAVQ